jgi:alanine racemase
MITATDSPLDVSPEMTFSAPAVPEPTPSAAHIAGTLGDMPLRPAWVEVDLRALRRNFELINADKPTGLRVLSVVKDDGYGHGALAVARTAVECGASYLAFSTLEEAVSVREQGLKGRSLLLGDRQPEELAWCVAHDLTCCVSESHSVKLLQELAARAGKRVPVHLKINTGMNRYGVRWTEAPALAQEVASAKALFLEGVLSHFAQSDEADKTYANLQLARFNEALAQMAQRGVHPGVRHLCNSGGFLDLPDARFDMVRLGILPLGVFPSSVCRRIPGIQPVMSVKARLAAIQKLEPGDSVGYGMRYTAASPRRIAVLPIGYGDGFPRVRNQGCVLVHGRRAPLIGGVAMDALTIDLTEIPEARVWDEAVVMGRQGEEEISVHEVAKLKGSVSYDVLTAWRSRLPRVYVS